MARTNTRGFFIIHLCRPLTILGNLRGYPVIGSYLGIPSRLLISRGNLLRGTSLYCLPLVSSKAYTKFKGTRILATCLEPMPPDSIPPSSGKFLPEEISTANHRLVADALAHLYEIQEEVEKVIQHAGSLQNNSHLRLDILSRLSVIKKKIRQFESYLGIY